MHSEICPSCDSLNTIPFPHVEDLFECLDCGDVFEDDSFTLKQIRERRRKPPVKQELPEQDV